MAESKVKIDILADSSSVKTATDNLRTLFGTMKQQGAAAASLTETYRGSAKTLGKTLVKEPSAIADKAAQGGEVISATKKVSDNAKLAAKTLAGELNPALAAAANDANKLARIELSRNAKDLSAQLNLVRGSLPQIGSALAKTSPVFRGLASDSERVSKTLRDQKMLLDAQQGKVERLRKAYDASVELSATTGEFSKTQKYLDKLLAAEEELKRKIVSGSQAQNAALVERKRIEDQLKVALEQQTKTLKVSAQELAGLTDKEKIRLLANKAQVQAEKDKLALLKQQSEIDTARRQAYAITIAGNQLKQYGQQFMGLATDSEQAFASIDYQIRRATAAMGTPIEMLDEMTNAAKRTSEQLGYFSSAEIAKGMYFFGSTTGQTVKNVEDLNGMMSQLTPIMQAAAITSSDLETTIKGVYGVLQQFSMPMSDAGKVTEELYYAAQKTAAELPDFIESLKMLGPVAANLGVPFEDVLRSLGALANSGIRGTSAGRALRQMFLQLNDPANRATEALDAAASAQYGVNTSFKSLVFPKGEFIGMSGYLRTLTKVMSNMNQEQRNTLIGIISTAAETPALNQLLKEETQRYRDGRESLIDFNQGIGEATTAQKMFAESLEIVGASAQANLGKIQSAGENIKATIGEALAPAFERLALALTDISLKFDEFYKKNPQLVETAATVGVLGAAVAVVGGALLSALGAFVLLSRAALPQLKQMAGLTKLVGTETVAATGTVAKLSGVAKSGLAPVVSIFSRMKGFITGIFSGGASKLTGFIGGFGKAGGAVNMLLKGLFGIGRFFSTTFQVVITAVAGFVTGFVQAFSMVNESVDGTTKAFDPLKAVIDAIGIALSIVSKAFELVFEAARAVGITVGRLFGPDGPLKPVADFVKLVADILGFLGGKVGEFADGVISDLKASNAEGLDPYIQKMKTIDQQIKDLEETQRRYGGTLSAENTKRLAELKAQKDALVVATEAARLYRVQQSYVDFRAGERVGVGVPATPTTIVPPPPGTDIPPPGGTTKKTAREKALELAQQAASLAEALYKIDGINLKALVKRSMANISEAMLLAIKYAAPYAKKLSAKTAESVGQFAETVGKVAASIGAMADAALKLETYKTPPVAILKRVVADMSTAMKYMIAESKKFKGSDVIAVQLFSDSASAVVGAVGSAVDAFNSMAKGVYQPPKAVLVRVAQDISAAVSAFVAQLKNAPTQKMLDTLQSFSSAASSALGVISTAVGAFKDLKNYVRPLPETLQAVVDTIELAVRKMIVSMGKFSLNNDQLEVVNTFATTAGSIANAISATYDAFVKQFDFVEQFRTEIDYDKVFGWIEAGIRKMADIAGSMPYGMVEMAKDAAEAASSIAEALSKFFELATSTGGQPALVSDQLQAAVNSVLAIIEAFATSSVVVGASFVDSLISGMQSRESALASEAARLTQIMGSVGGASTTRNNASLTITHVISDPNGVLKNASATDVAAMLNGDKFITNLKHSINTQ
jgi:TP901 family phage tail tape measure protein